ncbi:MAG: prenyltransferase/squalene oxidase repeat-containing protein [Planctomycetaceae bacterium]
MRSIISILIVMCLASPVVSQERRDSERDREVDSAIARALEFLSKEQQPSGAWVIDSIGDSTAATSLAVMSFLAAGHMPGEGPYGEQIEKGIRWVCAHQERNGMLVARRSHGPMYSHGISTLMLAEVIGMVDEADAPTVRRALEAGIRLILESQAVSKDGRHTGGWRYQGDSRDSDLSVTGWQVMALRAAKDVGCDVPKEAIDRAIDYVKLCSARDNRGFGYQPGNGQTPTLTGTGITCLEVCGDHHTAEALGGAQYLLDDRLDYQDNYFYYGIYYTGVGMHKMGGEYADAYREHLIDILIPIQEAEGSWQAVHGSERSHGRVYATTMAVLALAVEYRYLPIYQR